MNFFLQNNLDSLIQIPIYSVGETSKLIRMGDNVYAQPNENISNFTNINYYNNTELPNIINITNINGINQEFFPLTEASPTIMNNTEIITNNNLDNYVPNYNNNFQIIQPIPTLETNYENQVFGPIEIPTQITPHANDLNKFFESIEYNYNTLNGHNAEYTNIMQNTHLENKNDVEQPLIVNNSITNINTNITDQKLIDKNPSIENLSLDIDDYEIKKKLESYELSKSFAIMNDEIPSKIKDQPKLDFQPNINIQIDNFDQTIPFTTSNYLVNNELNTIKNKDINKTGKNSLTYITESTEDTLGPQVYYSQKEIIPVKQINNNQTQEIEYEYVYEDQGNYLPQPEVLINPSTIPINTQVQQEIITPEYNLVNVQPMIYQGDSTITTQLADQNQDYTIINQNETIPSIVPQTFNTYNAPIEPIVNPLILPTVGQMFIQTPTIPLNYTNQTYI